MGKEQFHGLTGLKKTTFEEMVKIMTEAFEIKKARGGRPNKLIVPDMVLITLEYLREYRTYFHIEKSYGLSESNVCRTIKQAEDTLVKRGTFSLPGKKAPRNTEKRHSIKIQVVVNKSDRKIICLSFGCGKKHDYKLFVNSKLPLNDEIKVITDTGYLGIKNEHQKSEHPKKKSKNHPLTLSTIMLLPW